MKAIILVLFATNVFSQNAKIGIVEENIKGSDGSENENEFISVELRKPNEDIKFVAQVRIHLKDGHVHVNDHPLDHNAVHSIKMMVLVTDIINGQQNVPQRKSVELRILVEENNMNGVQRLLVEEEFIAIDEDVVEQIEVKRLIWKSNVRVSMLTVKLTESHIHQKPRSDDHKMFIPDKGMDPHVPDEGQRGEHRRHCYHHYRHENTSYARKQFSNAKCFYHHLDAKAKIALFSLGFFGLLTAVICCGLCAKRRQHHRALNVSAPMDDTVVVDVEDKKASTKEDEGKFQFHFEFDNKVAVDDKKALVEEA